MYMRAPLSETEHDGAALPAAARWAVAISVVLVLAFGVLPQLAISGTDQGARAFVGNDLDRVASRRP